MWRDCAVDQRYLTRVRSALFGALLRTNGPALVAFVVVALVLAVLAAVGGDWWWAGTAVLLAALLPLFFWRTATRMAARLPQGSRVAYAVTPDGTLHISSIAGTATVNPGHVTRIARTGDCWMLATTDGLLVIAPRELLPDADVALLGRRPV